MLLEPVETTLEHRHTFDELPPDVAAYCFRLGQSRIVARGEILTRQGAAARRCYYVRTGYAKLLSTAVTGGNVLVCFAGPCDVIGQSAVQRSARVYFATSIATDRMDVIWWHRETALRLAAKFPQVAERLESQLVRNAQTVLGRLHTVSEGSVSWRLATVLIELASRHGEESGAGIAIRPRVTREDFAGLTGTSMYTVSRVLADWEKQGLLTSRRGRIVLNDVAGLRALAMVDASRFDAL